MSNIEINQLKRHIEKEEVAIKKIKLQIEIEKLLLEKEEQITKKLNLQLYNQSLSKQLERQTVEIKHPRIFIIQKQPKEIKTEPTYHFSPKKDV